MKISILVLFASILRAARYYTLRYARARSQSVQVLSLAEAAGCRCLNRNNCAKGRVRILRPSRTGDRAAVSTPHPLV